MLRFYQSTSQSEAKSYYTDALAKEDYYVPGRDITGNWGGKAAALLGLDGQVDRDAFAALCENRFPGTSGAAGERLTPKTRDDRTVGYDVNFHAPKSVSVLHALTGDERIVEAMRASVAETMAEIEAQAHTRVRLPDGAGRSRSEDRRTGNLAWGEFVHFTTRPVGGVPDPHLHVHCFVFNATYDHAEERWKAGQFRHAVRDTPYFQLAFHTRLAAKLKGIGYPISRTASGWELSGVAKDLVTKFSRRTAEIEATAKRLGITDPVAKSELGAKTRKGKDRNLSPDELGRIWYQRLNESEAEHLHAITQMGGRESGGDGGPQRVAGSGDRVPTATESLDHAVRHMFERNAVVQAPRLVADALKFGLGEVQPAEVWAALDAHPEILSRTGKAGDGAIREVTTRAVLEEETAVLRFAVGGKGTCVPLVQPDGPGSRDHAIDPASTPPRIGDLSARDGITLNPSQTAAIEHLLSSRDRVMLLRGGAGTGKTTLLKEAAHAITENGRDIFAVALTTDASRGVLREAGFKDAETVKRLLTDPATQSRIKDGVLWVDEASMIGTPTMRKLFELAEKQNARVILAGDTKQHAPVERGDAMSLLEREAGIKPAEVTEIIRQQGVFKEAVAAVDKGELVEGVELLDKMGSIKEVRDFEDPQARHKALAERYVEAAEKRHSCLVVSPTHAEGKLVTHEIRAKLKESGKLEREDREVTRLKDQQWTEAQKADAHNYEPGMMVQFTQNVAGSKRNGIEPVRAGLKARVIGANPEKGIITTEDAAGNRRPLPLNQSNRFGVFREEQMGLAVGDRVRITHNARTLDAKQRLQSGTEYRLAGFTDDGHLKLASGTGKNTSNRVVSKHVGHLTHAYCSTPQAAQGKSVDVCLAAISASSLTSSNVEQVYVMLSRAKKSVELMTDRRSAFIDAVARSETHRSATELARKDKEPAKTDRLMPHAREGYRLKQLEKTKREMDRAAKGRMRGLGRSGRAANRDQSRDRRDRGFDRDRGERGERGGR